MKLPFSFNIAFVFRLFLPGFVLACALCPAMVQVLKVAQIPWSSEVYFALSSILLGWLLVVMDMPIYMLYEGRRFWPDFLRRWGIAREERRLHQLLSLYERAKTSENVGSVRPVEYAIGCELYPRDENGKRKAGYPTHIGNVIEEYETYATTKYGVDGVFYWYRIWLTVPKDIREELIQQQAVADSGVYMSLVFFLAATLSLVYAMMDMFGFWHIQPSIGAYWLLIGALAFFLGILLYLAAIQSHAEYGSFFKAMFDQFYGEIDVKPVLSVLSERTGIREYEQLEGAEAYKMAWRYLRWHRLRRPGESSNVNAEDLFAAYNKQTTEQEKASNHSGQSHARSE